MFVAVIALTICLIFTLVKWWQKYCLYMGLIAYIVKNKLPEPTVEEMHEHVSYVAKKTIEDLFRKP